MANSFAWLVLLSWPLVALTVYAARRSSGRLARTTAWMMILPVMFLPVGLEFKQPLIPALDKHRLSFLSIAVALQIFHRRELLARAPWHQFPRLVLLVLTFGVIQTVRTNGDVLTFGRTVLPALTAHDAMSITASFLLDMYLPFAVGQRVFRTERDVRDLFDVLGICALIYAPFCLIELRLSPQFHNWVYGYATAQFVQSVRAGGYRPIVFMGHGLSVAMFMFSCLVAGLALDKVRAKVRPKPKVRAMAAGALVVLCKSLASIIYAFAATFLRFLLSSRAVGRVVVTLAVLAVAYPSIRASNVFPATRLVEFFEGVNADRAESLSFRFRNEDGLLARAMARPLFGWGTFGRNRLYVAWDYDQPAQDISVTDGYWIILLGGFGFVGFAGFFALMVVPLLRFARNRARMPETSRSLVGALALMVAVFTVDLLPNSLSSFLSIAYAGALFTLSERLARQGAVREPRAQTVRSRVAAQAYPQRTL
jgi:hypothetical protein